MEPAQTEWLDICRTGIGFTGTLYNEPLGYNIDRCWRLHLEEMESDNEGYTGEDERGAKCWERITELTRRLMNTGEVEAVGCSFYSCPYSQGNSWTSVEPAGADSVNAYSESLHRQLGDVGFFEVFGIHDVNGKHIRELEPEAVIDAILAKKNLGTSRDMAPLTVGLGPGFTAGEDVDYVIETMRGHNLGRIIKKGSALPNTGVPGLIAGIGKERVIHSPAAGNMKNICQIADLVEKDQVIAMVGDTPVKATISGVIRGLIRDGYPVFEGMKIADIDPRAEQKKNCFTISDKARCIAGGVLEVLLSCGVLPGTEKAVRNENL